MTTLVKYDINLEFNEKECIVDAILNGLEKSHDYFTANRTITSNGREGERWNYINEEVKNTLADKFEVSLCKRRIWEIILIYDKETRSLYSLMKDKRLGELREEIKSNGMHYATVLATSINSHFQYEVQDQMTFIDESDSLYDEKLEENFKEITKYISGDIDKYTMITFTNKNQELTSISARIVSSSLDDIYKEDWSDLIKPKYDAVINEILGDISLDEDADEDIEVPIKEDIMRKNNKEDINIGLKKHQEKKQEIK